MREEYINPHDRRELDFIEIEERINDEIEGSYNNFKSEVQELLYNASDDIIEELASQVLVTSGETKEENDYIHKEMTKKLVKEMRLVMIYE